MRQITLNLLSNAVKFTPTGGEIRVRVGWTAGGGQYISVKDNGPGIPEDEIPVVLSAFGQGSIAIKSAEQGTGLGLPIVQGLLAMHGGEFELHSKLREGTEAIAIFPASRVMEALPAIADADGRCRQGALVPSRRQNRRPKQTDRQCGIDAGSPSRFMPTHSSPMIRAASAARGNMAARPARNAPPHRA